MRSISWLIKTQSITENMHEWYIKENSVAIRFYIETDTTN